MRMAPKQTVTSFCRSTHDCYINVTFNHPKKKRYLQTLQYNELYIVSISPGILGLLFHMQTEQSPECKGWWPLTSVRSVQTLLLQSLWLRAIELVEAVVQTGLAGVLSREGSKEYHHRLAYPIIKILKYLKTGTLRAPWKKCCDNNVSNFTFCNSEKTSLTTSLLLSKLFSAEEKTGLLFVLPSCNTDKRLGFTCRRLTFILIVLSGS